MKIRMKKTVPGSPDGISHVIYEAGKEYDINVDLAEVFIVEKFAEKIIEESKENKIEEKEIKANYENKEADIIESIKTVKGKKNK